MTDKSHPDGDRIAKVIARAGLASRREAEAWIMDGRVSVNGRVISSPALNVAAKDKITIDGQPLPRKARTRLFLCNKPRGLVTTHSDPEGRPTIFSALPKNLPRLISIGRLDMNTEGLLLLTNDGGLARALELPATGWLRRYRVRALGRVTQETLDGLKKGVTVEGVHYGPIEATLERQLESNCWLAVGIREGKNREVRKVMESLGLKVSRLIRIAFGPFELGPIAECAVKEVETPALRKALGPEIIKLAEADFDAPLGDEEMRVAKSGKPGKPERGKPAHGKPAHGKPERGKPHQGREDSRRHSGARPQGREPGIHTPGRSKKRETGVMDSGPRAHARDRNDGHKWPGRAPQADTERPETGRHKHKKRGRPDRSRGPRPSRPRPK